MGLPGLHSPAGGIHLRAVSFVDTQVRLVWLMNLGRIALIGCLAYLIRCSLMRAREHDADVQASLDPACRKAIIDRLEGEEATRMSALRRAFSDYPSNQQRIECIASPALLFQASAAEFFVIAFTILQFCGIHVSPFLVAVQDKWEGASDMLLFSLIPFLFYPTLIFLVFGISIGRLKFKEFVSGVGNRTSLVALASGSSAGLWAGIVSANTLGDIYLGVGYAAFVGGDPDISGLTTVLPVWQLALIHLLTLGIHAVLFLLSFIWLQRLASAWLPIIATITNLSLARSLSVVLLLSGLALSLLPMSLLIADAFVKSLLWLPPDKLQLVISMPFILLFNPLNGLPILAAGFLPIAAALLWWTHNRRKLASWTTLPPAAGARSKFYIAGPQTQPLRSVAVGRAIAIGAWLLLRQSSVDDIKAQAETLVIGFWPLIDLLQWFVEVDEEVKTVVFGWVFPVQIIVSALGMVAGALHCPISGTVHGIISSVISVIILALLLPMLDVSDLDLFWFTIVCLSISLH